MWYGILGGQSTLGLKLTGGFVGCGVPLNRLAAVLSGNAVSRFGLSGKRRIEPGADADLAVVDLERERVLETRDLFHRHGQSSYAGRGLRGRVVRIDGRSRVVRE